jgi:hypothetical protein
MPQSAPAEPGVKNEPWPIANAIACLEEVRDRESGSNADPARAETVRLTIDYAIEVVKALNTMREPQPPDPAEEARKAVRKFAGELGQAIENLGLAMQDIADGNIPERDG